MKPFRFNQYEKEYVKSLVKRGKAPRIGLSKWDRKQALRDKIDTGELNDDMEVISKRKNQLKLF